MKNEIYKKFYLETMILDKFPNLFQNRTLFEAFLSKNLIYVAEWNRLAGFLSCDGPQD